MRAKTLVLGEEIGLAARLEARLRATSLVPERAHVTVALSGGLDSVVLLDLLQSLAQRWSWTISAAHFDHRMRENSSHDAMWVRQHCEERGVECRLGRAQTVPAGEAAARDLRYAFLDEARLELGSELLATAHQADDQAETVLFRLLRGTGLAGLGGIPARRSPGIVRPLLPYWRREIQEYAHGRRLEYLDDPTNRDPSFARNRIRNEAIPALEAGGHPDIREQLHRLAGLASRAADAVGKVTEEKLTELILESSESRIIVAHKGLLAYDTTARAHLLRALAGRVGPHPGRVGTRVALEFINTGRSGRGIDLAGGVGIRREFDRIIIERHGDSPAPGDGVLAVAGPLGTGHVEIGGESWRVDWAVGGTAEEEPGAAEVGSFAVSALRQPLTVRGWRPGDRIQLCGGTRKLKKLFVDRRVGRGSRGKLPLLVDGDGVLWVVGLVKSERAVPEGNDQVLSVRLSRE
jgi:tRNA(Ile)-lysidine synthase